MKRRKNKNNTYAVLMAVALIIYGICFGGTEDSYGMDTNTNVEGEIKVSFVDVGQADCILIQNDNENMLIDAGNNEDGEKLVSYFESLGINNFKYVVGTHPHEDHIGGLDDIINNFEVSNIYMPDVITTTMTFEDVIDAIDKKNLTITVPEIGDVFDVGDASVKVLYTGVDDSDLNDTSIVLKLYYGNVNFLFTGDATENVEKTLLDDEIESNVLKVGHHGSKYSSTSEFLEKVNPEYAVISVGAGNSYGHPESVVLNRLSNLNTQVYRTDEKGTIVITSDGDSINIDSYKTDTNGE